MLENREAVITASLRMKLTAVDVVSLYNAAESVVTVFGFCYRMAFIFHFGVKGVNEVQWGSFRKLSE